MHDWGRRAPGRVELLDRAARLLPPPGVVLVECDEERVKGLCEAGAPWLGGVLGLRDHSTGALGDAPGVPKLSHALLQAFGLWRVVELVEQLAQPASGEADARRVLSVRENSEGAFVQAPRLIGARGEGGDYVASAPGQLEQGRLRCLVLGGLFSVGTHFLPTLLPA
jgi:hypothetical protein